MYLRFSYTFSFVSRASTNLVYSPHFCVGGTRWYLAIRLVRSMEKEYFKIILFGKPKLDISSDDMFSIKADYKAVLKSHVIGHADYIEEANGARFYKDKKGEASYGNSIYSIIFSDLKAADNPFVQHDQLRVEICLVIREIDGIQLPRCDFANPGFFDSDLVIRVNHANFYCHSQILKLNSPVFRAMIITPKVKTEREKVFSLELDGINNIFDFEAFLYMIYNPRTPPNEYNVENLLFLAQKFEVDVVIESCDDFLSSYSGNRFTKEQKLALGWRYKLRSLMVPAEDDLKRINFPILFGTEHYRSTPEASKLTFCETIIKRGFNPCA